MEIDKLSDERYHPIRNVSTTAKRIDAAFKPDKISNGEYADAISHLHIHVVPNYK